MLARTVADQKTRVLIIDDKLTGSTSFGGRAVRALVQELNGRGIETIESVSFADGRAAFAADASIDAILIGWTREGPAQDAVARGERAAQRRVMRAVADRQAGQSCFWRRHHPLSAGHSDRHARRELRPKDGPWLSFMRSLQDWCTEFPGFGKEVEGSVVKDGVYHVWCLKND